MLMGIQNSQFRKGDVYFKNDNVMFFYNASNKKCFRKFVGESNETEVSHDNKLMNEAILFGNKIEESEYKGKEQ